MNKPQTFFVTLTELRDKISDDLYKGLMHASMRADWDFVKVLIVEAMKVYVDQANDIFIELDWLYSKIPGQQYEIKRTVSFE